MLQPWQTGPRTVAIFVPLGVMPLRAVATGAFPVPESLAPDAWPASVKESYARLLDGPPKPAVTLAVMGQTQTSMIAPDLPFKANV